MPAKPTAAAEAAEAVPPQIPVKFPTGFYQANGILLCPNGDKVRSDESGLFCLIDGQRVAYDAK